MQKTKTKCNRKVIEIYIVLYIVPSRRNIACEIIQCVNDIRFVIIEVLAKWQQHQLQKKKGEEGRQIRMRLHDRHLHHFVYETENKCGLYRVSCRDRNKYKLHS